MTGAAGRRGGIKREWETGQTHFNYQECVPAVSGTRALLGRHCLARRSGTECPFMALSVLPVLQTSGSRGRPHIAAGSHGTTVRLHDDSGSRIAP